ncbi:MAG: MBL fold metallo-hydrolase [Candidatus Aenigmatarchaeota archaeon]
MKITFLGGAGEVGRNAFLLEEKQTRIMLDFGVRIQPEPPTYPEQTPEVDAIILSHAHLDHCGGIPALYRKGNPMLVTNDVTLELIQLLINDSMKISRLEGFPIPYDRRDVQKMLASAHIVPYRKHFDIKQFRCEFYDAGHIPGSCGTLIESKESGKRIFYTGDIDFKPTELLNGCNLPGKIDTLIIECTYSNRDHPPREKEKKRFLEIVESVVANNERALFPVFALGRSQEVLLILEKFAKKVSLDGMAKSASDIILQYPQYLRNAKRLRTVLNRTSWVYTQELRKHALKHAQLIVSPAGMLSGGPILFYLGALKNDKTLKILLTGFQVEDSAGFKLVNTGMFEHDEEHFKVAGKCERFDFSSHAGRSDLFKIIEKVKPKRVICIHGDDCKSFAREIKKKYNISATAPDIGETIEI